MKTIIYTFLAVMIFQAQAQIVDMNANANGSELFSKGTLCLEAKDYNGATDFFKEAIAYNPEMPDYYYGLGLAQYYMNRLDASLKYLNKAINMDDLQGNYFYYVGAVYYAQGEYDKSRAAYLNAVLLNETSDIKIDVTNAKFHIGVCHMKLDDYYSAIKVFNDVLEAEPQNDKALLNRGISRAQVKQFERACNDFEQSAHLKNERARDMLTKYCYSYRNVVVKN